MSPRTLVISAAAVGVVLLVVLQWLRPEKKPAPPVELSPVMVVDLVAAESVFVAQVNRLAGGESLEQVRTGVTGDLVEDDAQTRGYCFPDREHCSQRVILRFNAEGRLYQVQSSVPHIPARHYVQFQPATPEPSKMTAE